MDPLVSVSWLTGCLSVGLGNGRHCPRWGHAFLLYGCLQKGRMFWGLFLKGTAAFCRWILSAKSDFHEFVGKKGLLTEKCS